MIRLLSRLRPLLLSGLLWFPVMALADVSRPAAPPVPSESAPPPQVNAPEAPPPAAAPAGKPGLPPAASPAVPEEAFNRALKAYNAGAIEDARREFLAIVESGNLSAPLAHNLGNVEFRRGNPGQAVLWYKRALALQPFSPETLQNLRTVRRQTAFLSFDPLGLSLAHVKLDFVKTGTILTAWAIGLVIVWLAWLTPRRGRRWPLVVLLFLLIPALSLGAWLTWKIQTYPEPLAKRQVISGPETKAYAAPAEASSTVMSLPSGSEVVPVETRGNWVYCVIPGGEEDQPLRGWIRAASLEPLWPWAVPI